MNEANEFLTKFSFNKEMPDFWWEYSKFTKNIGKADIDKLVENIPDIITKIENDGASQELYNQLDKACESDVRFGKQLYDNIIKSNCDGSLNIISSVISGISKNDFEWAKEKILCLMKDSNKLKVNQAISSIGSIDFSKDKSAEFIQIIDRKFTEIINTEDSNKLLATVLFAIRNQREHLPNADKNILALLTFESVEIKIQLLNVLTFNTDINTEENFYKKILFSLVSLDLKFVIAYNSLAYRLKGNIENHFLIVKEFLNSWVSLRKENARNIKLLHPILDEIYNSKLDSFQKIMTEWLNEDNNNFHIAVFELMREMSYRKITSLQLDSSLVQSYEFKDLEYITRKIIGYVLQNEISTSLLYSILKNRHNDDKVVSLVSNIFIDYLIFNYYSTLEFLKEMKKDTKGNLEKVITRIIEEGEKYYSAYTELEILKEFEPSESRMNHMNKIQNRKFNKSYEENDENRNSFLSMCTTLHFRAGKSAFGKFNNEYSAPMQPQLVSHSAEMPRGEYIDPTGQAQLRLESQLFTRRI